ncbi:hypothetical protein HMPREF9996_02141 [Aggregatibacter actinomycetemcomitans Y4]|nr:hypothetical protein HMPREF9996_02141 [Aggregatibacter actinomycetemcomitans Y4]
MEDAVEVLRGVVQAAGVAAVVDNNEHLRVFGKFGEQVGVGLCADVLHGGTAQSGKKCGWFWGDFAHVFKAAIKAVFGLHGRLGSGAHHDGATVGLRQFFNRLHDGQQKRRRQHLRFVEDDDGACDVVQFAAARGAVGKEGFEELHGGADDDGHVPVFGGAAQFVFGVNVLQLAVVKGAVVFQHGGFAPFAEGFAELGGVLFDDAGKRDDVDDAPHSVPLGVFQRKRHGGEGFAAAGGDGEGEQAGRLACLGDGVVKDFAAQAV